MRAIGKLVVLALVAAGCSEGSQDVPQSPGGMTEDELRSLEARAQIAKAELEAERRRLEELRRMFCPAGQEPVAVECRPVDGPALPPPVPTEARGDVRQKLSREDIKSGMAAITGTLQKCFQGAGGGSTVTVQATIAPSGRVSSAMTVGQWAGTPAGLCAARVVRGARFPQSLSPLTVTYPFKT